MQDGRHIKVGGVVQGRHVGPAATLVHVGAGPQQLFHYLQDTHRLGHSKEGRKGTARMEVRKRRKTLSVRQEGGTYDTMLVERRKEGRAR